MIFLVSQRIIFLSHPVETCSRFVARVDFYWSLKWLSYQDATQIDYHCKISCHDFVWCSWNHLTILSQYGIPYWQVPNYQWWEEPSPNNHWATHDAAYSVIGAYSSQFSPDWSSYTESPDPPPQCTSNYDLWYIELLSLLFSRFQ